MVEYIPGGIFRASFKFCMGDKIREKMANSSWRIPIRIGSMVAHFQLLPYEYEYH
jgi:hypothetical protein